MLATSAGVHAASITGIVPAAPKAKMMSVKKCIKNPVTTPDTINIPIRPRRGERSEKTAAIKTVPIIKNGFASKVCQ